MKVQLKNVKYFAAGSEETSCFVATVYIDGVKAGAVENDGRGGAHYYSPHTLETVLADYAKSLPAESTPYMDPLDKSVPFVFQPNADTVVDRALDDFLQARDLRRLLSTHVLYVRDGRVYQTKRFPAVTVAGWCAKGAEWLCRKVNATAVLNLMPFDSALTLYRAQ